MNFSTEISEVTVGTTHLPTVMAVCTLKIYISCKDYLISLAKNKYVSLDDLNRELYCRISMCTWGEVNGSLKFKVSIDSNPSWEKRTKVKLCWKKKTSM